MFDLMQINNVNDMAAKKIWKVQGGKRNSVKKAMASNTGLWCMSVDTIRVSAPFCEAIGHVTSSSSSRFYYQSVYERGHY